jgi:hypothetical protein
MGALALDAVVTISLEDGFVPGPVEFVPKTELIVDARARRSARLLVLSRMIPANAPLHQLVELQAQVRRIERLARDNSCAEKTATIIEQVLQEVMLPTVAQPGPVRAAV